MKKAPNTNQMTASPPIKRVSSLHNNGHKQERVATSRTRQHVWCTRRIQAPVPSSPICRWGTLAGCYFVGGYRGVHGGKTERVFSTRKITPTASGGLVDFIWKSDHGLAKVGLFCVMGIGLGLCMSRLRVNLGF